MGVFKKLFRSAEDRKGCMVAALLLSAVATILSFVPYYFLWKMLHEITGDADYSRISKLSYLIFGTTIIYMFTYITALHLRNQAVYALLLCAYFLNCHL